MRRGPTRTLRCKKPPRRGPCSCFSSKETMISRGGVDGTRRTRAQQLREGGSEQNLGGGEGAGGQLVEVTRVVHTAPNFPQWDWPPGTGRGAQSPHSGAGGGSGCPAAQAGSKQLALEIVNMPEGSLWGSPSAPRAVRLGKNLMGLLAAARPRLGWRNATRMTPRGGPGRPAGLGVS